MEKKKFQLPKAFAEKWLAALRSGEYNQTQSELYNEVTRGYCCLGVACVLSGLDQHQIAIEELPSGLSSAQKAVLLNNGFPEILLSDYGLVQYLTCLNDGETGWSDINKFKENERDINVEQKTYSFSEIADWVEENVELV